MCGMLRRFRPKVQAGAPGKTGCPYRRGLTFLFARAVEMGAKIEFAREASGTLEELLSSKPPLKGVWGGEGCCRGMRSRPR